MKKSKKLLILILSAITLFCMSLGIVGCTQKEIKLVGFDDITVEGSLYEDFSVAGYLIVVDTYNNTYRGTVEVTDYENNLVELVFNRFELTSLNPYLARISVKLPNGKIEVREITIEVKSLFNETKRL